MKKIATSLLAILAFGSISMAQDSIPRFPLIEVFTSSTCGPCKGGNENLNQIIANNAAYKGKFAIVKYQMSWPGSGDPYYTSEAGSRRGLYGVTGVPNLQINGDYDLFPPQMGTTELDQELQRYSYLQITPHLTWKDNRKTLDYNVELKALSDIAGPVHKLYVMITEKITYNNKKSNGETEFEAVLKKMMPSGGEFVLGDLPKDTTINFTGSFSFQGNYRLPGSANDPIDHQTEHSVEDFDNLEVVVFVQHLGTKEVLNAAYGYDPNDKTDPHHPDHQADTTNNGGGNGGSGNEVGINQLEQYGVNFALYPNPVEGQLFLQAAGDAQNVNLELFDLNGQVVYQENLGEISNGQTTTIGLESVQSGMYLVRITGDNLLWQDRVVVH
ncbi:T9SS type A sorting domain-containing protein [bacterium SCSIO 12741]|nr:T9SS type A sorting domain-containing protein [bacterium SCSIO 12741]